MKIKKVGYVIMEGKNIITTEVDFGEAYLIFKTKTQAQNICAEWKLENAKIIKVSIKEK